MAGSAMETRFAALDCLSTIDFPLTSWSVSISIILIPETSPAQEGVARNRNNSPITNVQIFLFTRNITFLSSFR